MIVTDGRLEDVPPDAWVIVFLRSPRGQQPSPVHVNTQKMNSTEDSGDSNVVNKIVDLIGGFNMFQPPWKKYESQIGSSSQLLGKIKHVPNQQPETYLRATNQNNTNNLPQMMDSGLGNNI